MEEDNKNEENGSDTRVSVFVRVRPLTGQEALDPAKAHLEGLKLTSSGTHSQEAVALETSTTCIDGFSGILGQEANNRRVFEECFVDRLSTVLRGGTASLFCYGYTGGGKTHTCIGYGEEKGLFFLAAEQLLNDLNSITGQEQSEVSEDEKLFLRATVCEIYLDDVFDLIGPEKRPCKIRVDGDGQLVVHGEVTTDELQGVSEECRNGTHSTLVTLAPGLRSIPIHRAEDLQALSQTCITQRACGTSTANETSSRSHAILRLEVVSHAINRAKDTLQLRQAELPALKNAYDNCRVNDVKERIRSKEREIQSIKRELERLHCEGSAALGGSMLLVDLAGADYDHRGGPAQTESTAINKSLLALKECFRSIAASAIHDDSPAATTTTSQPRPPFRRSKLTRILEDSLAPRETSCRRNKESVCVMLVNVSPASNLKHGTINALRYGQLFAGGQRPASTSTKKRGRGLVAQLRKQTQERLQQQTNDPNVNVEVWKQEIRQIYSEHVPEKSKGEVEDILLKFSGREQGLLERVRAKYTIHLVEGTG